MGFGGNLLRIAAFDAGRHLINVYTEWSARNESSHSWGQVGLGAVNLYGDAINSEDMGCISDRDKGLARGLYEHFDRVSDVCCHTHLKVDVASHCGAAAVKPFVNMAFAPTKKRSEKEKAKAPPQLLKYLSSMELPQWAKSHHKTCMEGRSASSVRKRAFNCVLYWS